MHPVIRFAAFAFLTAACSADRASRRVVELPLVRLEARDFAFTTPTQIPAGRTRVRLVNVGPTWHEANISRLPDGETLESYLAAARGGDPFPVAAVDFGGPGKVVARDSSDVVIDLGDGE